MTFPMSLNVSTPVAKTMTLTRRVEGNVATTFMFLWHLSLTKPPNISQCNKQCVSCRRRYEFATYINYLIHCFFVYSMTAEVHDEM